MFDHNAQHQVGENQTQRYNTDCLDLFYLSFLLFSGGVVCPLLILCRIFFPLFICCFMHFNFFLMFPVSPVHFSSVNFCSFSSCLRSPVPCGHFARCSSPPHPTPPVNIVTQFNFICRLALCLLHAMSGSPQIWFAVVVFCCHINILFLINKTVIQTVNKLLRTVVEEWWLGLVLQPQNLGTLQSPRTPWWLKLLSDSWS